MATAQNPPIDPNTVLDELSNMDSSALLRTVFSFMTDDEFSLLDPITANLSASDIHDLSKWESSEGHAVWDVIYSAAEATCSELQLSSEDCKSDCLYYNSIPNWIPLILSNDTEDKAELLKMVEWYSVSAGPISWYDVGNVDMCQFFEGTYCYTPALSAKGTMQHSCCVPGTCTGEDALKMVYTNNWCYKSFATLTQSAFQAAVPAICDPVKADMQVIGGYILCTFLKFVVHQNVTGIPQNK